MKPAPDVAGRADGGGAFCTPPARAVTGGTWLRWIHLAVGGAGLLAFLLTGQFMDRELDHLRGMADAPRALYRSGHIYLLFSALLNLGLGSYARGSRSRPGRLLQGVGSMLLIGAVGLFLYGFFVETPLGMIERPMVRSAISWCLWGVLLHVLVGLAEPQERRPGEPAHVHGSPALGP